MQTRTRRENRDPELVARNLARFEGELAKAEPRLAEHAYLCGASFTLADIQFGHVLYRYFETDLNRAALPHLRGYYERLCDRPAYRKTVMVSFDTLKNTF